jgi:multiple sugar transport system substrate-binding protein
MAKRGLAVGVAIGAVALGVAGCGSSKSSSSSGTVSSSTKVTISEEDYYTSPPSSTFWPSLEAEYHKLHPNISFKRSSVAETSYVPHLLDQAGAGSLPDIVMIDNPYVSEFAKTGVLTPLTGINTSAVAPTELYDGIYNGKLYAVPPYTNTIALAYNKTELAAAHLTPPKTWAELISDAKALTTSSRFGFVPTQGLNPGGDIAFWNFAPFLWTNAGANATNDINSPAAVAALNVFVDLERDGSMPKSAVSWTSTQGQEYFQAGKAALAIVGPWEISTLNATKGLKYGIVEMPTRTTSQTLVVPTGGETWAMPTTTSGAAKAASIAFLKWLLTPSVDVKEAVGQGGLVPTVKSAVSAALKEEDPTLMEPFAKELVNGGTPRTKYLGTAFSPATTTIGNAIDAAVTGTQTAQQALDGIASQVKSELKSAGEG